MGIKTYFQQRILERENNRNSRHKLLSNFMDMKSILVLCSVKSMEEWQIWNLYFDNLSTHLKKVDIIAFVDAKNNPVEKNDHHSPLFIFPQHINWLGKLKDQKDMKKMMAYDYDLVIDLNFNNHFILNLAFVRSKSSLKVCSSLRDNMQKYGDLIIKTDFADTQQKLYINQVFYYLRQINSNGSN